MTTGTPSSLATSAALASRATMPSCSLAPPDSESYGTVRPSSVRLRMRSSPSISTSKSAPNTMRPNRSHLGAERVDVAQPRLVAVPRHHRLQQLRPRPPGAAIRACSAAACSRSVSRGIEPTLAALAAVDLAAAPATSRRSLGDLVVRARRAAAAPRTAASSSAATAVRAGAASSASMAATCAAAPAQPLGVGLGLDHQLVVGLRLPLPGKPFGGRRPPRRGRPPASRRRTVTRGGRCRVAVAPPSPRPSRRVARRRRASRCALGRRLEFGRGARRRRPRRRPPPAPSRQLDQARAQLLDGVVADQRVAGRRSRSRGRRQLAPPGVERPRRRDVGDPGLVEQSSASMFPGGLSSTAWESAAGAPGTTRTRQHAGQLDVGRRRHALATR